MEFVTIELLGKKVILLNGVSADNKTDKTLEIEAPDNLREAALRNPDAVAFGFVSGRWVAGA